MKKKWIRDLIKRGLKTKTWKIMRLSALFLLVFASNLLASSGYAQQTKLTLKMSDAKVIDVLDEIENSSEFYFLFNQKLVDVERKVNVNAEEKTIEKILNEVFDGTDVRHQVTDRLIILTTEKSNYSDEMTVQQQKSVSGKITDATGQPLPGVTVVIKGTTIGTVTQVDGTYSLQGVADDAVLQFSFIGMETQEVVVGSQTTIDVVMRVSTIGLEEVVAIGYGTMKKSDLTGSVSSINESSFKHEPIQRMEQMLEGRASGVVVTNTSGAPNSSVQVRIRGANSINGGNEPLYIVDGIASKELFNILDVNDIKSIEVLKDASSTAIYGSRGANGVVLVTTKKGSKEKSEILFETQQSWGTITNKYDMLSTVDYANFYNEYRKQKGATNDFYSADQINNWAQNGGYNWQDMMFRTAYTKNYKLAISGGNSKTSYIISGNVRDAEGILIESGFKQYAMRANIDSKAFDWLNINFEVNGAHKESANNGNIEGTKGVIWGALVWSPTVGLYDEDGNWAKDNISYVYDNPYGIRMQDKSNSISNYFGGNIKFTFDLPIKGLTFDVLGSANYQNSKGYWISSAEKKLHDLNAAGNSAYEYLSWQNTNQLTYTNKWDIHRLTATVVAEYTEQQGTSLSTNVNNLLTESVGYWNLGLGSVTSYGNGFTKTTLASYVGRAMYQLNDKYLLTATVRRDGSSKFQGDNKWGYFPSVALAWRASDESFITNLNIFDQLKFRASWGVTGNQAIGAYSTLGMLSNSNHGWGTATAYPGYWAENTPTPDLTWEKTYQWDAGLDLGFFNNRLTASIDMYLKNTKDLLLSKAIPYYDGGGSVYTNIGHVRNKGFELSLNVVPVQNKSVNWQSTVNVAYSKNKVINMGGDERLFPGDKPSAVITFNPFVLEVGESMGSIWGYTWQGLWGTDEANEAALYGQKPGDNKFLDKNDDYKIDSNDQGVIGKAFPDITLGWNNTVSWNNFDFNLFFQGAIGADRLNFTRFGMSEATSEAKFVTSKEGYYNMWTEDNQDTNIPNIYSTTIRSEVGSTQYLESADFLRLKNLSIGYNVPLSSGVISSLNVSASVQNVFTITSYKGYDPETTSSGVSDTMAGMEEGAYPIPRTFTIGLRANF